MSGSKKVFVFGYSGHAYVVIESLLNAGFKIGGYFDYEKVGSNPYHLPYFGFEREVNVKSVVGDDLVFPTVGEGSLRQRLVNFFYEHELNQFVAIDPSANISNSAVIGVSTYIGKNVSINAQSKIGIGVILNTQSVLEHECLVDDFVHVAPGAVLCGSVSIGRSSFVGANSVIKQSIQVCSDVIIGAGSVVIKSIKDKGTWVGSPASLK